MCSARQSSSVEYNLYNFFVMTIQFIIMIISLGRDIFFPSENVNKLYFLFPQYFIIFKMGKKYLIALYLSFQQNVCDKLN